MINTRSIQVGSFGRKEKKRKKGSQHSEMDTETVFGANMNASGGPTKNSFSLFSTLKEPKLKSPIVTQPLNDLLD